MTRQNSGSAFSARTKPFHDRKRSANLENVMLAAGVANLKVDETHEDAESMVSSRLVTGNLDGSMDDPGALQLAIDYGNYSASFGHAQHAPGPFNKYSSHHSSLPHTPTAGMALARNSMPSVSGKGVWGFTAGDDPQNSVMPEIAESVISREEDDFEEAD